MFNDVQGSRSCLAQRIVRDTFQLAVESKFFLKVIELFGIYFKYISNFKQIIKLDLVDY